MVTLKSSNPASKASLSAESPACIWSEGKLELHKRRLLIHVIDSSKCNTKRLMEFIWITMNHCSETLEYYLIKFRVATGNIVACYRSFSWIRFWPQHWLKFFQCFFIFCIPSSVIQIKRKFDFQPHKTYNAENWKNMTWMLFER